MDNQSLMPDERVIALLSTIEFLQAPITIDRITEGSESRVWSVNGKWIFRIHTAVTDGNQLINEIKLLDFLRATPLSKFIIPCSWSMYLPDESWHCALYAKAAGLSIEAAPELVTQVTEDALARVLFDLKSLDVEDAKATGIKEMQPPELSELREKAIGAWRMVCNDAALHDLRSLDTSDYLVLEHNASNAPNVMLHADLKGEHLFVERDGSLTSVIDWTDACIGPPSIDIAGMTISVGATATARIGSQAGYERSVVEEGIFVARCNAVVLLAERLSGRDNSPIDLLRIQLRRAFEEYELVGRV